MKRLGSLFNPSAALLLLALFALSGKDWPSTSGTTARGIVIEDGAGNAVTNLIVGGVLSGANGGTGVANTGKTITLGGNLTTSGAFNTTLTVTATTNSTLPAGTHSLAPLDAPVFSSTVGVTGVTTTGGLIINNSSGNAAGGIGYTGTSMQSNADTWNFNNSANNVAIASLNATALTVNGIKLASLADSITAPTIASGGCTTGSAQIISASNGTADFDILLGGATCGSTITLTLPAVTTKWHCTADDITTPASNEVHQTAAASTTSVVLTNFVRTTGVAGNFTAADHILVSCRGH